MRTTLDIERRPRCRGRPRAPADRTVGEVISELPRNALSGTALDDTTEPKAAYGCEPFPANGKLVTDELIDGLRDRGSLMRGLLVDP